MPTKKLYDLVATVGTYESRGETKKRYQTVGSVMQSDDGRPPFVLLSRTFNPAGVPVKDGADQVLLGCFEPRTADAEQAPRQQAKPAQRQRADYDDSDIQF